MLCAHRVASPVRAPGTQHDDSLHVDLQTMGSSDRMRYSTCRCTERDWGCLPSVAVSNGFHFPESLRAVLLTLPWKRSLAAEYYAHTA